MVLFCEDQDLIRGSMVRIPTFVDKFSFILAATATGSDARVPGSNPRRSPESQAVTHPSTNMAKPCLTSIIGKAVLI